MIDLLDLLIAVNTKDGSHTTKGVAVRLEVSVAEAERALRKAERDGLIVEDCDESRNVGRDFDRQYWRLSDDGRRELYRLMAEQPG